MDLHYVSCQFPFPIAHNQVAISLSLYENQIHISPTKILYSSTASTTNFKILSLPPHPSSITTPQMRPLEHFPPFHPPPMPRFAEIRLLFLVPDCFRRVVKADGNVINSGKEYRLFKTREPSHTQQPRGERLWLRVSRCR